MKHKCFAAVVLAAALLLTGCGVLYTVMGAVGLLILAGIL